MYYPFILFTRSDILRLFALFLLGILLGSAITTIIMGHTVENLQLQNSSLESMVEEQNSRLERLEAQLKRVVKRTSVHLNITDERTLLELTRIIQQLLEDLVGQRLTDIDPVLVHKIIEQRPVQAAGQAFTLSVTTLVISEAREEITIYVEATPTTSMEDIGPVLGY